MDNALRSDRALFMGRIMTEHERACLMNTCGKMERLQMMASFQVNAQQGYQPAGYLRDLIRIVMEPKWDKHPRHLVTPVRSDGLSAMTVLQVLTMYRERQRILCQLGVTYTIGQV